MRLIDADPLRDDIETINYVDWNNYSDTVDFIDDAPTIEAELVKHGKWIDTDNCNVWYGCIAVNIFQCSVCKKCTETKKEHIDKFCYCPRCGAKMEKWTGEREENK